VTINSVGSVATMILAERSCAGDAALPASVCAESKVSGSFTRSAMFDGARSAEVQAPRSKLLVVNHTLDP
jgi:hypothetical protein